MSRGTGLKKVEKHVETCVIATELKVHEISKETIKVYL